MKQEQTCPRQEIAKETQENLRIIIETEISREGEVVKTRSHPCPSSRQRKKNKNYPQSEDARWTAPKGITTRVKEKQKRLSALLSGPVCTVLTPDKNATDYDRAMGLMEWAENNYFMAEDLKKRQKETENNSVSLANDFKKKNDEIDVLRESLNTSEQRIQDLLHTIDNLSAQLQATQTLLKSPSKFWNAAICKIKRFLNGSSQKYRDIF